MNQQDAFSAVKKFRDTYPNQPKGFAMTVTQLALPAGAAGWRFYNGLNQYGALIQIPVPIDANGNDILPASGEAFKSPLPCPTYCSGTNSLNSDPVL